MNRSTDDNTIARKPRPKQAGVLVGTRFQPDLLNRVDAYRAAQRPIPSRPEAVRRLTHIGIEAEPILREMLDFFERSGDPSDSETQAQIRRLREIFSG